MVGEALLSKLGASKRSLLDMKVFSRKDLSPKQPKKGPALSQGAGLGMYGLLWGEQYMGMDAVTPSAGWMSTLAVAPLKSLCRICITRLLTSAQHWVAREEIARDSPRVLGTIADSVSLAKQIFHRVLRRRSSDRVE